MDGERTAAGVVAEARGAVLAALLYAAVITAFVSAAMLIYPLFMLEVYTRVIPARSHDTLWAVMGVALFGLAIYGLIEFSRGLAFQAAARGAEERLNGPALKAAAARAAAGEADAAAVLRDMAEIRQFFSGSAVSAPIEAAWSVIFVAVLYLLHPVFGHLSMVAIALMLALGFATDRLTRGAIRAANEGQAAYAAAVGAAVRHGEAIEGMGMMPALLRRWSGAHRDLMDAAETAAVRARAAMAATRAIGLAVQVATIAAGAVLVLADAIATGSLFMAMILAGRATQPFGSLVDSWRHWVTARAAWARLESRISAVSSERQSLPATCGEGASLEVDRLVYLPPGRQTAVLKQVSFRLSPGEVVGVAGPSGAGKSTLARLIVGVARPTAGGVYLDGHDTYLWERGSFGRAVGYLPQALSIPDGTVAEVIARMDEPDPAAVIRAARAAGVHEMIGRLPHGYDTPVREDGRLLSGGQMQRLALARALYGDPRLIVLDEPNSNLDTVGERALAEAVAAAKARGAMVLIIAHRPSVMAVADRLIVLDDGRIAQEGPLTEVLDRISPQPRPRPVAGGRAEVRAIGRGDER